MDLGEREGEDMEWRARGGEVGGVCARGVPQGDSWGYPRDGEPVPGQEVPIPVQGSSLWSPHPHSKLGAQA